MKYRPVAEIRSDLRSAQFRLSHAAVRGNVTDEMRQAVQVFEAELAATGRPLFPIRIKEAAP